MRYWYCCLALAGTTPGMIRRRRELKLAFKLGEPGEEASRKEGRAWIPSRRNASERLRALVNGSPYPGRVKRCASPTSRTPRRARRRGLNSAGRVGPHARRSARRFVSSRYATVEASRSAVSSPPDTPSTSSTTVASTGPPLVKEEPRPRRPSSRSLRRQQDPATTRRARPRPTLAVRPRHKPPAARRVRLHVVPACGQSNAVRRRSARIRTTVRQAAPLGLERRGAWRTRAARAPPTQMPRRRVHERPVRAKHRLARTISAGAVAARRLGPGSDRGGADGRSSQGSVRQRTPPSMFRAPRRQRERSRSANRVAMTLFAARRRVGEGPEDASRAADRWPAAALPQRRRASAGPASPALRPLPRCASAKPATISGRRRPGVSRDAGMMSSPQSSFAA